MRTVFSSNSMLAHVYCQGAQSHGRAGNMSFDGAVCYSYSTPIARIVETSDGARALLILIRASRANWSPTTARHISEVSHAFHTLGAEYRVPSIGAYGGWHAENGAVPNHGANLDYLAGQYAGAVDSWRRRISEPYSPESIGESLADCAATVADYARAFNLTAPAIDPDTDARAILAYRAERAARRNTPAAIAKRARDKARRRARMSEWDRARAERRDMERAYSARRASLTPDERRAEDAARDAEARAENAATIAQWRAGENVYLPWSVQRTDTGSAMLRLRGEDTVQTSQGADVPLAHARRLFAIVAHHRAHGREFTPNGHSVHVGHFTVSRIDSDGNLTAGCHFIDWLEISRFAESMKWEFPEKRGGLYAFGDTHSLTGRKLDPLTGREV